MGAGLNMLPKSLLIRLFIHLIMTMIQHGRRGSRESLACNLCFHVAHQSALLCEPASSNRAQLLYQVAMYEYCRAREIEAKLRRERRSLR